MTVNLDEITALAQQLDPEDQNLLIYRLRIKQMVERSRQIDRSKFKETLRLVKDQTKHIDVSEPSRQELIQELETLRAEGAFDSVESLYGKYVNAKVPEMNEEAFHAQLNAIATEWEQELDDLDTSSN